MRGGAAAAASSHGARPRRSASLSGCAEHVEQRDRRHRANRVRVVHAVVRHIVAHACEVDETEKHRARWVVAVMHQRRLERGAAAPRAVEMREFRRPSTHDGVASTTRASERSVGLDDVVEVLCSGDSAPSAAWLEATVVYVDKANGLYCAACASSVGTFFVGRAQVRLVRTQGQAARCRHDMRG